jgi:hypothetical protein
LAIRHEIGTDKIENQLQKGERRSRCFTSRAFRMSKEEVSTTGCDLRGADCRWLLHQHRQAHQGGTPVSVPFPRSAVGEHPPFRAQPGRYASCGSTRTLSATVFGGKQNNSFWQTVFETGKSPQGVPVMPKAINLVEMIK